MKYVWILAAIVYFIQWAFTVLSGAGDGAQYLAVFLACLALSRLESIKRW